MKIFGFVESQNISCGQGDSRSEDSLVIDTFFQSRKLAENEVIEDEKKPSAGRIINGRFVEGKSYIKNSMIREFELKEI